VKLDRVWEIAKKDMTSVKKYKYILLGLVVIPILFAVVIPLTSLYPVISEGAPTEVILRTINLAIVISLILPAITPSTIASYTFVGEKVNKQLEPLLATPTSDFELLSGKGLGAFLPTIGVTWGAFIGFMATVNVLTFAPLGYFPLPTLLFAAILLCIVPLLALFSVLWCVFISSRVTDVRASIQLGIVGIAPVFVFYSLIALGYASLDWVTLGVFAICLILVNGGLFSLSKATFRREEILTRWK
jgi:ABC-type Na+ efflux pump permease subunit